MREPETLTELKEEILRQLRDSEIVTIQLTEGDGIHELLESIEEGIQSSNIVYSGAGLLSLLADIRAAVGDPEGRLMQDELVRHCRKLREDRDRMQNALESKIKQAIS